MTTINRQLQVTINKLHISKILKELDIEVSSVKKKVTTCYK